MKRFLTVVTMAAIAAPAVFSPAWAQDDRDWDMVRDPRHKSVLAYVQLTSGLSIAVRCVDGAFDAVIAGLPEAPRGNRTRVLQIGFADDDHLHDTRWNVTTDRTVALADYPSSFARALREGGELKVQIAGAGGNGRPLRHVLEIPASSAAIGEVLTACDKPLEDPRDALLPEIGEAGLPAGLNWSRPPRPRYPFRTRYAEGYAVVSCVAQPDGRVDACQIETQHPADGGFGDAALEATGRARLVSPNEAPGAIVPRIIGFRVNFMLAP